MPFEQNREFIDEHVDSVSFSLIYTAEQDNCLEVYSQLHGWIKVVAPEGAAVVMIGVAGQVNNFKHLYFLCAIFNSM